MYRTSIRKVIELKKWRCTVCDYIHTGDEPPERCPVCGKPREAFVLLEASEVRKIVVREFVKSLHLHPIIVHFPNALFPLSLFFLVLFLVSGNKYYEGISFIMLFIAVIASPMAFVSGLIDWQIRYGGSKASIFVRKIVLSIILIILGVACLIIHLVNPDVMLSAPLLKGFYVGGLIGLNILTVALGYLGGRIIF